LGADRLIANLTAFRARADKIELDIARLLSLSSRLLSKEARLESLLGQKIRFRIPSAQRRIDNKSIASA